MILHAPLALLAVLFVVSLAVAAPNGPGGGDDTVLQGQTIAFLR